MTSPDSTALSITILLPKTSTPCGPFQTTLRFLTQASQSINDGTEPLNISSCKRNLIGLYSIPVSFRAVVLSLFMTATARILGSASGGNSSISPCV